MERHQKTTKDDLSVVLCLKPLSINVIIEKPKEKGVEVEKVRLLNSYNVILTCHMDKDMEEMMKHIREVLKLEVKEVRKWSIQDACKVRRGMLGMHKYPGSWVD